LASSSRLWPIPNPISKIMDLDFINLSGWNR
jgi:hypothetical protein